MRIPVAAKIPISFMLSCPVCDCTHAAPNGSLIWTREEIELCKDIQVCQIGTCDTRFRLPRI